MEAPLTKQRLLMSDFINDHTTTLLTSIVAIITSIVAVAISVIKAFFMTPREAHKLDVDTDVSEANVAIQYEEALKRANDRTERIESRLSGFEARIADRDARIEALSTQNAVLIEKLRKSEDEKKELIQYFRAELAERDKEIADVRGWAEKLVGQVRDLGGNPIPFAPDQPHPPKRSKPV